MLCDKWRIERVLGVGGTATVYEAVHRNGRHVALKVLHPDLARNEGERARFLREGYLANRVDHAGAVAVLDDDVSESGAVFLVMELLRGQSLYKLGDEAPSCVPLDRALDISDGILDVLGCAHRRGLVHRDLKPSNIFLTTEGAIKLLDFGIAMFRDHSSATHVTARGALLGTPAFMAPEQARGDWPDVDARTDLWAVGAVMVWLLTGRTVHEGDSVGALVVASATRRAPSLGTLAPAIPGPIVEVVDRALMIDKSTRWSSAEEMRAALAAARARSPASTDGLGGVRHPGEDSTFVSHDEARVPLETFAAPGAGPSVRRTRRWKRIGFAALGLGVAVVAGVRLIRPRAETAAVRAAPPVAAERPSIPAAPPASDRSPPPPASVAAVSPRPPSSARRRPARRAAVSSQDQSAPTTPKPAQQDDYLDRRK